MDIQKAQLISDVIDKIPIIFTSIISIVTLVIGYKTGKRQSSINLITSSRIKWQEIIRDELTNFIRDIHTFHHSFLLQITEGEHPEKTMFLEYSKIIANGNKLILRLNPLEDEEIIGIIKEIIDIDLPKNINDIKKYDANIGKLLSNLVSESHVMLKKEWEKIKQEAGHKK